MSTSLFFIFALIVSFYPYYMLSVNVGRAMIALGKIKGYHWLAPYLSAALFTLIYSVVITILYTLFNSIIN